MPRYDDDDDRPRRRRPRDDDEDDDERPARSRRRDDDDEPDDRPRRRRLADDEDDLPPRRKKKGGTGLLIGVLVGVFVLCCGGGGFLAWWLSDKVGGDSRDRRASTNNLKQIGLAFHNHHDVNNALPNNTYAPDGRPLLSWRVHLLPYVGENALYQRFNLNEAWDGPTNRQLVNQMPRIYSTPETAGRAGTGKTFYRGFAHRGAVFEKPGPAAGRGNRIGLMNMTDGTSNTILVVEAGEAVEWTRPDDLDFSPGRPLPSLGAGRGGDQVLVLMADGSHRSIRKGLPESTWQGLTTYAGGEVVFAD